MEIRWAEGIVSAFTGNCGSCSYGYNNANQHTNVKLANGSYRVYQNDALGQVTFGMKYWSDGTPVAGQQFGYTFDAIGKRTRPRSGGVQHGMNLRGALAPEIRLAVAGKTGIVELRRAGQS